MCGEPGRGGRGGGGGGEAQAERQASRGVVGVRAEAKGKKGEAVRWNSGRMELNPRLVDTVLSCSTMGKQYSTDV